MNSSIGEILSNRGAFDGHSDWNESILESCGDEDENSVDPMPLKRESISLSKGVVSSLRKADAKRRGSLQVSLLLRSICSHHHPHLSLAVC